MFLRLRRYFFLLLETISSIYPAQCGHWKRGPLSLSLFLELPAACIQKIHDASWRLLSVPNNNFFCSAFHSLSFLVFLSFFFPLWKRELSIYNLRVWFFLLRTGVQDPFQRRRKTTIQ